MRLNLRIELRNVAAAALVAIVIGQFSLLLHDVLIDHEAGSACELCSGHDRMADGAVDAGSGPVAFVSQIVAPLSRVTSPLFRSVAVVQPRGPPLA